MQEMKNIITHFILRMKAYNETKHSPFIVQGFQTYVRKTK